MIYYPLQTLKQIGCKEICIVSGKEHCGQIMNQLGSGSEYGVDITYRVQEKPGGIAQALGLCKEFAGRDNVFVCLGDNIFEDDFSDLKLNYFDSWCHIFLKEVPDRKTWVAIIITLIAVTYIFHDSIEMGNFYGDLFGIITAFGLACNAVIARYAKNRDLVPSAVIGKLCVAIFAFFFVDTFTLVDTDLIFIPLMCVMCVAIPFVLVTIAPRFIPAEEVNLFFLLETIIGPFWVWLVINEQPSIETIQGGVVIILTIAIHSFLKLKKN